MSPWTVRPLDDCPVLCIPKSDINRCLLGRFERSQLWMVNFSFISYNILSLFLKELLYFLLYFLPASFLMTVCRLPYCLPDTFLPASLYTTLLLPALLPAWHLPSSLPLPPSFFLPYCLLYTFLPAFLYYRLPSSCLTACRPSFLLAFLLPSFLPAFRLISCRLYSVSFLLGGQFLYMPARDTVLYMYLSNATHPELVALWWISFASII